MNEIRGKSVRLTSPDFFIFKYNVKPKSNTFSQFQVNSDKVMKEKMKPADVSPLAHADAMYSALA